MLKPNIKRRRVDDDDEGNISGSNTGNEMDISMDVDEVVMNPGNTSPSFQYGHIIVERVLEIVSPFDAMPLRAVSKACRDFIDAQLFEHITVISPGRASNPHKALVLAAPHHEHSHKRLPGFAPRNFKTSSDIELGHCADLLRHTKLVDIESVSGTNLQWLSKQLCGKVSAVRLCSDIFGKHSYKPPFFAPTMIVFPSFDPCMREGSPPKVVVPNGVTKLVQHLASTVDGRGPVLFKSVKNVRSLKEEVWVFTHYKLAVDPECFDIYDEEVRDVSESLMHQLVMATADRLLRRLKDGGTVKLTLVDSSKTFSNIQDAYPAHSGDNSLEEIVDGIKERLMVFRDSYDFEVDEDEIDSALESLSIVTWDEYAAGLSAEELAQQSLPDFYLDIMYTLLLEKYLLRPEADDFASEY